MASWRNFYLFIEIREKVLGFGKLCKIWNFTTNFHLWEISHFFFGNSHLYEIFDFIFFGIPRVILEFRGIEFNRRARAGHLGRCFAWIRSPSPPPRRGAWPAPPPRPGSSAGRSGPCCSTEIEYILIYCINRYMKYI